MKKTYLVPKTLVVKIATSTMVLTSGVGISGLEGVSQEEYDGNTPVSWARGIWSDDEEE